MQMVRVTNPPFTLIGKYLQCLKMRQALVIIKQDPIVGGWFCDHLTAQSLSLLFLRFF